MKNQFKKRIFILFLLTVMASSLTYAQFDDPEIVKVEAADRAKFQQRFADILWTGQGFNYSNLDRIPTIEIRAYLQSLFGDPTQKIEEIMASKDYRPGKAIQFEYWFIVNGTMPVMILDLDGPFENGLVYVGASKYIDMMPSVKRMLTKLVQDANPKEYSDYFFSPERNQWYKVSYAGGRYTKEEIKQPAHIKINQN